MFAFNDSRIIALLLVINVLIVFAYLVIHLIRRQQEKGVLVGVFMLSMPIVGPLYLLCGELLLALMKIIDDRNVSLEELSFSKGRIRNIVEADVETECNVVPLEEARLISGKAEKRQIFLEMIKGNEVDNFSEIRDSVVDRDQEIAHYAAAYVTDMLARIKQEEAVLHNTFERNKTPQTCSNYIQYLHRILDMELFDGAEQRKYLEQLDNMCLWQLEYGNEYCITADMTFLLKTWMQIHDMEKAKQWFDIIWPRRYSDLDALKACFSFYYSSRDRDALLDLLTEVRDSALELDSEVLEWIQLYEQPNLK